MASKPNGITYHVTGADLISLDDTIKLDFDDLAKGTGVTLPQGWFTDNANGKIQTEAGTAFGANNSSNVIELEQFSGDASNLYTMIESQIGQQLTISFDLAQRWGNTSSMMLIVDGIEIGLVTPDSSNFSRHSFAVEGTGAPMKIEFKATDSDAYGVLMDNIEINRTYSVDLIANGSFEDVTGLDATDWGFLGTTGQMAGWTVTNGQALEIANIARDGQITTDGNNWLDLDASPGNVRVGQDVQGVVEGIAYDLHFDVSDSTKLTNSGSAENKVNVYWGGELIATIDPSNFDENEFATSSLRLIGGAGDGSNRLEFEGLGAEDNFGVALDNIRMFAAEPPVFPNQDPIANDDSATGQQDAALTIAVADLLANDTDPDGDAIVEFSVQDAVNGTVSFVGSNVVFTPNAGYSGPASFTYSITDGKGGFDIATVNLTIEGPATGVVATDDAVDGYANNNVVIAPDVLLGNDYDLADGNIYGVGLGDAVNGSVYYDGTNVVFVPEADYTGPASFTYTIKNDAGELDTATVNLTIAEKVVEGTDGDDAEVMGSSYSETIIGGLGSDNLYGGDGADTFVWRLADVSETPSVDVIKDGQAIDKIDISDLLQGEENGDAGLTKAEVLDSYLNLSTDGSGNTVMEINANGQFGTEGATVDQTIVIEGFDLTGANTLSDVQVINNLMNNLITD